MVWGTCSVCTEARCNCSPILPRLYLLLLWSSTYLKVVIRMWMKMHILTIFQTTLAPRFFDILNGICDKVGPMQLTNGLSVHDFSNVTKHRKAARDKLGSRLDSLFLGNDGKVNDRGNWSIHVWCDKSEPRHPWNSILAWRSSN